MPDYGRAGSYRERLVAIAEPRRQRAAEPAKKAAGRARPGAAGAPAARHAELLLDAITAYQGLRAEQIREHVGLPAEEVKAGLAALRAARRVKVRGKARGTSYFPVGARMTQPAARRPARRGRAAAKKATAPKPATPATKAKKRAWPTCSAEGCTGKFFGPSSQQRLCYQHFIEAGGTHPLQRKK